MTTPASFGGGDRFADDDKVMGIDPELEAIKARVLAMEAESARLKAMQFDIDTEILNEGGFKKDISSQRDSDFSCDDKLEVDARSVYVGNVDYGATAEELERHFNGCGIVNRVTILCNKYDGTPKGFAYIEFLDTDAVVMALLLDESLFRGRQIKVMKKRTNRPGFSSTDRLPWARGGFRGRGSYRSRGGFGAVYRPRFRGRTTYLPPY